MAGWAAAAWQSLSSVELQLRRYVQDVGEVHVGAGEVWIPQFSDWLYELREKATGCLEMRW